MSRPRLIALLLAFATLLAFLPAGRFSFLNYDDNDYVTDNNFVSHGLTATDIGWAFTAFHAGNWHPLTWISHMTDCELFGLHAGMHHIVSVLFHAVNVALLFLLLVRLTSLRDGASARQAEKIWPSAFIAALFAWHPLHVESVAWISERKDVLSTFFALLALSSYTRYAQKRSRAESRASSDSVANPSLAARRSALDYFLALIFFALGLMSKPMLVTLPFVLLLLDFWPIQRFNNSTIQRLLVEKIPFLLLAAASCAVTFFAQKNGEAVVSLAKVSLRYRLENAPVAVVSYLQKFFWPADLCAIYPLPEKIPALQITLSVAVLILISAAAWRWRKTKPYFLFGWLWFLGTLVPVIGLVQVGSAALANRYTYIPSIGFFIAVVFLLEDFVARVQMPKTIAAGIAAVILTGCLLATEFQLQFWRDREALFRRAVAVTRDNDIALVDLGVALETEGRFGEALDVYRQAEKIDGSRYQLHNNLGNVFDQLGRHAEALDEYRAALRLRPASAILHNAAGGELAALGNFDEALQEFSQAGRLDPSYAAPRMETAKVFLKQGRDTEAVDELRAALRSEPENFQVLAAAAHYLAANANAAARDGHAALALALKAAALSGNRQPQVFDVLGMACAENGDFTNAQTCAQNALDLANAAQMKNLEPLKQRLELYKNRQPWRESFLATNAPANSPPQN